MLDKNIFGQKVLLGVVYIPQRILDIPIIVFIALFDIYYVICCYFILLVSRNSAFRGQIKDSDQLAAGTFWNISGE